MDQIHHTDMANWEVIARRDWFLKRLNFIHEMLGRFYNSLTDIEKYCTPDEEARWLHNLLTVKARDLDEEAELLMSNIGVYDDYLVSLDCHYYGVCTESIH